MQYVKLRKNGEVYLELKTEIGGEVVVMVYVNQNDFESKENMCKYAFVYFATYYRGNSENHVLLLKENERLVKRVEVYLKMFHMPGYLLVLQNYYDHAFHQKY